MSKQKIKQIALAVLVLIIVFEVACIINLSRKYNGGADAGLSHYRDITVAEKSYKINNTNIPSYDVAGTDGAYFANVDLELFGFRCDLSEKGYVLSYDSVDFSLSSASFVQGVEGETAVQAEDSFRIGENTYQCFTVKENVLLIPEILLDGLGEKQETENTTYYTFGSDEVRAENKRVTEIAIALEQGKAPESTDKKVIVLDPGHGKASSLMTDDEKRASGWVQNSNGAWGDWRHYKSGSATVNCEGFGCNGRVTPNGACWYAIGSSDRSVEPEINLNNALAAKKYLEELGYSVRITRETNNENPSITRRLSYCHPNNDTTKAPDAEVFVCIHSNASGGSSSGSAYISLDGDYDQKWIKASYADDSNRLGRLCNDSIVNNTSLKLYSGGVIGFEPELVAFCKAPVPCGYLEIGFFDNKTELELINTESDAIGKAIALGIDAYFNGE